MTLPAGGAAADDSRPFSVSHRTVLAISVPMMLAYLSTPLVGMVSTAVIGQLDDAALLGGVALATVLFDVVFAMLNFLRGATTGLAAQAIGAGDELEEQAVLARAGIVAVVCGILIVSAQSLISLVGFAAFGATEDINEAGRAYFLVRIWSGPFLLINYVILGWVLGRGEGGCGLLLQTLLNGLNIVLCIWFVLVLGWGVEGAAFAALVAELLTAIAGGVVIWRRVASRARPHLGRILELGEFRRMMAVNTDMMVRSLALLLGIAFFTQQSAAAGAVILAANSILLRFYLFATAFLDGIATAAEQLAGRAVGARFQPAFDRTVTLTMGWGLVTALLLSAILLLTGPLVIDLTTPSPEIRQASREYLVWAGLLPLAGVIAFQMDGIFIGATWSKDMRNMMVLSLGIFIAAWAVLHPLFGNHGLWMAMLIFHGARSITFRWRMRTLIPRTFPGRFLT